MAERVQSQRPNKNYRVGRFISVVPVRIVVDEREKNSDIPELLRNAGAVIDFAQLKVGDYIVSPETAVERKILDSPNKVSQVVQQTLFEQDNEIQNL